MLKGLVLLPGIIVVYRKKIRMETSVILKTN